ncbi:MAG: family 43 glycosylhydrolase [Cyanobacteria bacterium J06606_4]
MTLSSNFDQTAPCWDPWILKDKDTYRVFYLSGRTDQDPWWRTSWICGACSEDLQHWQHTGPILEPLSDGGWESGRLFAGSAYKREGRYYLFYSAASRDDIASEVIGLAISDDGLHWQRSRLPLLAWAEAIDSPALTGNCYAGRCSWASHLHWRDPYIVNSVDRQKYYMFFCASLPHTDQYQGGLGLAVADQLGGPYQLLPPAAGPSVISANQSDQAASRSDNASEIEKTKQGSPDDTLWPFYHLERPQIVPFQGRYHLFFSCFKEFVNPQWLKQIGAHHVSDSTLYWYVSDSITGPFLPSSSLPVVPGSDSTGLYGTTFFDLPPSNVELAASETVEMKVVGWYSKEYRLAIAQEFSAIWTATNLKIVANGP